MQTNDPHATGTKKPSITLWLPPLSPKEQQRIDRARRRQSRPTLGDLSGFKGRTMWDYLNLLAVLAIPILIAAGTLWYTSQQTLATTTASTQQHQTDESLAEDQQEETALQTYLDRMSDLLFTEHLALSQPGDEVRQVARARTLTLLPHLNQTRKGEVIHFLYEAKLLGKSLGGKATTPAIVDLSGADLSGADLGGADLSSADLSGADLSSSNLSSSNLSSSNLRGANLSGADLRYADLRGADLRYADLRYANLLGANLLGADLRYADLSGADLRYADLSDANLLGANLRGADLIGADLLGAINTTTQQLNAAFSLAGAILPDGSRHS